MICKLNEHTGRHEACLQVRRYIGAANAHLCRSQEQQPTAIVVCLSTQHAGSRDSHDVARSDHVSSLICTCGALAGVHAHLSFALTLRASTCGAAEAWLWQMVLMDCHQTLSDALPQSWSHGPPTGCEHQHRKLWASLGAVHAQCKHSGVHALRVLCLVSPSMPQPGPQAAYVSPACFCNAILSW